MNDIFGEFRPKKQIKANEIKQKSKDVYGVLVRVSTDMQVDGDSIPMQKDRAMEIIESNNGTLYKFYIEEGVSASKNRIKDREYLQELLSDIEAGIVNKLIAYKRDRLTRNTQDYLTILEICSKAKCDIVYSASGESQMMNDPVTGKVLETFLASIAEMESANTSMRVRDVMVNKASKGEFTGFTLPYGYTKSADNQIVIEEGTELIVQEIEDLYLGGVGTLSIAKWLNGDKIQNLGIRPDGVVSKEPKHKKRVSHWTKSAIESVLFNPYYAGIIEYSKEGSKSYQNDYDMFVRTKGQHPPLRTIERQKEIYKTRERKVQKPPRAYNTTFLFTGLIYCGECGAKYGSANSTKHGKRYSYYSCTSKKSNVKSLCKNKTYKKEILEEFIESSIEKHLSEITFSGLEKDIVKELMQNQDDISVKLNDAERLIKELTEDEQKILRLLMDLDPNKSTYTVFKERYESELEIIFEKANNAKRLKLDLLSKMEDKQDEQMITQKVLEKMQNFNKVYRNSPIHLRKIYLDEIIERIELYQDGTVELYFKIQLEGDTSSNNGGSQNTGNESNGNKSEVNNKGIKIMNADTGEEVIINGVMGDPNEPKIITTISLKLTIPSSITLNIEEWRREVAEILKTSFPLWLKRIAGGEHITAYRIHKDMGIDKGTMYKLFNNYSVPDKSRVELFANFYNSSVDDFVQFTGLNLSKNIIFDKFFQWSNSSGKVGKKTRYGIIKHNVKLY